jgi:hypothetical protein
MKSSSLSRYALSGGVAVALLAGCGALPLSSSKGQDNMQLPVTARGAAPGLRNTVSGSQTFNYSGNKQLFVVPAGVTKITVVARGASGNELGTACTGTARGARVYAVLPVTPGQTLEVYVGGEPSGHSKGGFNGGGRSGEAGGGGGASDVRRRRPFALAGRILVAAGGGGAGNAAAIHGHQLYGCGGNGGEVGGEGVTGYGLNPGEAGVKGVTGYGRRKKLRGGRGGGGATQSEEGAGGGGGSHGGGGGAGQPGWPGSLGMGGYGGFYAGTSYGGCGGGGGGGEGAVGYWGTGGGGGGGSSYVERSATDVHFWDGWKNATGNGLVVFSW